MRNFFAIVLAVALCACSSSSPSERAKPAEAPEEPATQAEAKNPAEGDGAPREAGEPGSDEPPVDQTPTVTFHTEGGDVVVAVEIAADVISRKRGMMYRENLEEDRGMVFVFDSEDVHPFWMKNTYIALDMIHLDRNLQVVGIVEEAEPLTLSQRKIDKPSKYVVEVVGGFADKHGITTTTRASLANVPSEPR